MAPHASVVNFTPAIPKLPGRRPLLGHLAALRDDYFGTMDRVRALGDAVRVHFGPVGAVVLSDPAMAQRVLVDNVANYTKNTRSYVQLRKMLGNGLVASDGAFWLRQRRIAQPAFHRERIHAFAQLIAHAAEQAVERWPRSGAPFDFAAEMMRLTMRVIGEVLFSLDLSGETDAAGAAITELVEQAFTRLTAPFDLPLFVPTPQNLRYRRARRMLDGLILGIIAERRRGDAKQDLLGTLLDVVDEDTGERMSDSQLRDELLTMFFAGHETTSTWLSWTMHELLEHPEIQARLREEILQSADAPLSPERLIRLPYLDAVLKESMRVHPPVFTVSRWAVADDTLAGVPIAAGTLVFVSIWNIHRHPRLWRDPARFDPERFLAEDPARHRYAFFPFLGGPRKCIGDQLAILEAKIILATVLARTRLERVKGHVPVGLPSITLRMKTGLPLRRIDAQARP